MEHWSPTVEEDGDAAFPDLTFLQLLFGHRSLEELDHAFADCSPGEGDARVLLGPCSPGVPLPSGPFAEFPRENPGASEGDVVLLPALPYVAFFQEKSSTLLPCLETSSCSLGKPNISLGMWASTRPSL